MHRLIPRLNRIAVGSIVGLAATAAGAAEPSYQELAEQVRQLQARVQDLESKPTARPAADDETISSVLRDADQHSQLLQDEGFTAGYSNGKFVIQSADGNFVLNPNVQLQFREVTDYRRASKNDGADDVQNGFELRRLKFAFDGNVFSPDFVYKFQWATNRKSGVPELDEAWVRYHFKGTPWAVRGGQIVDPWAHESGVSSKRQLAVERSLLNELLVSGGVGGENYVQGVSLIYADPGPLRAELVFHDGFNSRNTNFTDSGGAALTSITPVNFGVTGRAEYKLAGDWKQYEDFTALGNKADLLVLGGGLEWTEGNNGDELFHTVDVQWEPQAVKGLSLYGGYVGLYRDFNHAAAGIETQPYDWGFIVQGGYLLSERWEVFGRYDYINLDPHGPTGSGTLGAGARVQDVLHEITGGVNYYVRGHAAKLTLDATWLPNGSPFNADGIGVLAQPNDKDQIVLRAQFQLLL